MKIRFLSAVQRTIRAYISKTHAQSPAVKIKVSHVPITISGGCRHCATVHMWWRRTYWPGSLDVPEIPLSS